MLQLVSVALYYSMEINDWKEGWWNSGNGDLTDPFHRGRLRHIAPKPTGGIVPLKRNQPKNPTFRACLFYVERSYTLKKSIHSKLFIPQKPFTQ